MIKSEILRKFNVNEKDLIGKGTEAEVYIYDKNTVLKIYNGTTTYGKQQTLKNFYDSIDYSKLSYELPYIYSIENQGDIIVTIEKRIEGKNMQNILPELNDEQLNSYMKNYLSASLELQSIKLISKFDGYLLFNNYNINSYKQKDWNHFLKKYLLMRLSEVESYLNKDVLNFKEKLNILFKILSREYVGEYSLIHGDFYPGNLLVNDDGKITGLIDFGIMTMYGDYLFDIATSWVFFDMYNELQANILERYLDLILTTLGHDIETKLYLYVMLYSIFSANFYSKDCSDGHYLWCINNLNNPNYWHKIL